MAWLAVPSLPCHPGCCAGPCRLRLPADAGAAVLQEFAALEFAKHAQRFKALWASELYR